MLNRSGKYSLPRGGDISYEIFYRITADSPFLETTVRSSTGKSPRQPCAGRSLNFPGNKPDRERVSFSFGKLDVPVCRLTFIQDAGYTEEFAFHSLAFDR